MAVQCQVCTAQPSCINIIYIIIYCHISHLFYGLLLLLEITIRDYKHQTDHQLWPLTKLCNSCPGAIWQYIYDSKCMCFSAGKITFVFSSLIFKNSICYKVSPYSKCVIRLCIWKGSRWFSEAHAMHKSKYGLVLILAALLCTLLL